jgi:hypothetical protein
MDVNCAGLRWYESCRLRLKVAMRSRAESQKQEEQEEETGSARVLARLTCSIVCHVKGEV